MNQLTRKTKKQTAKGSCVKEDVDLSEATQQEKQKEREMRCIV